MKHGTWMAVWLALACNFPGGTVSAQGPRQFSGLAAYYDKDYHGRTTRGEPYNPEKFTAAHRTLPFGTRVRVTDLKTKRSVVVIINDRGPFTKDRVLDLSLAAAKELGMIDPGVIKVTASVQ
jgi:rare lipoprotein A